MKKRLLKGLIILLVSLLTACSGATLTDDNKEKLDNVKATNLENDLYGFAFAIGDAHCELKGTLTRFWKDYYSDQYQIYVESNGNDIALMHALGKQYINQKLITDSTKLFDSLDDFEASIDFPETLRLVNLSRSFWDEFINGSANLIDFDDFKENVVVSMTSFNDSIDSLEYTFDLELENYTEKNPSLKSSYATGLRDLNSLCAARLDTVGVGATIQPASISLKTTSSLTRSSNNAFYIYGETSSNCSQITVEATNDNADIYDSYTLNDYSYGDSTFKYGIREDWNNLGLGSNTYEFTVSCDDNQTKTVSTTLTLSVETPSYYPIQDYSGLSNDNYYTNSYGQEIHSPAYSSTVPSNATAICNDGTYSFSASRSGTCSHHGGVDQWL